MYIIVRNPVLLKVINMIKNINKSRTQILEFRKSKNQWRKRKTTHSDKNLGIVSGNAMQYCVGNLHVGQDDGWVGKGRI